MSADQMREAVARAIHSHWEAKLPVRFRVPFDTRDGESQDMLKAMATAALTALGLHDGRNVVAPVEATDAMFMAAGDTLGTGDKSKGKRIGDMAAAEAWRRMLAARPGVEPTP